MKYLQLRPYSTDAIVVVCRLNTGERNGERI